MLKLKCKRGIRTIGVLAARRSVLLELQDDGRERDRVSLVVIGEDVSQRVGKFTECGYDASTNVSTSINSTTYQL